MKKRFYVFRSEYKNFMDGTGNSANVLTLVATFEEIAERDALRFTSAGVGGPYYMWTKEEKDVEEVKR